MIPWPAHTCASQPDDAGGAQSGEAGCRVRAKPAGHMCPPEWVGACTDPRAAHARTET